MENQELNVEPKSQPLETVSHENAVTIRCLSAIPPEIEALLAEIAQQEQGEQ